MLSFLIEENEGIRKFLEGDDKSIPVSEYRYLHERPLLRPSFLTQIDDLVKKVGEKIVKRKLTGKPVDDLTQFAISLGQQMDGELTDEKVRTILFTLRKIYVFCNDMDKKIK
jgi:hypothetical protein